MTALGRQAARASLAVAGIGAAMAAATVKAINHADSIAKTAKAAQFGAETYQEITFAASQFGVAQGQLDSALVRFTKRLGLADQGTGAAIKAYEKYGIATRDLNGDMRTSEDVFRQVADVIGNLDNEAEKVAATTQFFGDDAARLALLLGGGTRAIDEMAQTARELGLILDADLLRNAEAASDELDRMKRIATAQATVFASSLFPAVISLGNAFAAAAPHVRNLFDLLNDDSELRLHGRLAQVQERIQELQLIAANPAADTGVELSDNPFLRRMQTILFGGPADEVEQELNSFLEVERALKERIKARAAETAGERIDVSSLGAEGLDLPGIPTIGDPEKSVSRAQQMLEQLRRDRQLENLEAERQTLIDNEALTQELEAQFRESKENAIAASEARIAQIKKRAAEQQARSEEQLQTQVASLRNNANQHAISLLQALAGQSKGAQLAMLALQKGAAIAQVLIQSKVAAMRALAELGPIAGPPVAAKFTALGATNAGLIAATGLAQGLGGGGGGSGGGSAGGGAFVGGGTNPPQLPNPASSVQESSQNAGASTVRLVFDSSQSTGIVREMIQGIRAEVDEGDAMLFSASSRQALELGGR